MTAVATLIEAAEEALEVIRAQDRELGNYDPNGMARLRKAIAKAKRELAKDDSRTHPRPPP